MAITSNAQLEAAVATWLARTDLAAVVPDLIMIGEKWIFRHARTREMETALSFTLASGEGAVPSDYVAVKHARIAGSPTTPLRIRPSSWIYEQYPLRSSDAKPGFMGVDGSSFIFGPFPDSNYDVAGIYYARPTTIASSANALFLANPDIYLYAALVEAEPYLKNDKRLLMWKSKRDSILADMNAETREAQQDVGGGMSLG